MYLNFSRAFFCKLLLLLLLLFCAVGKGYGQRVYATSISSGGSGNFSTLEHATSPDGISEPVAMPRANISVAGAGLGGSRTGFVNLKFNRPLPANTIVYIKVSERNIGLSSSISLQTYNDEISVGGSLVEYITMKDGSAFYRVSSSFGFNSIRLTATGGVVLVAQTAAINIHYAFYESSTMKCAEILGVNTETGGLGLGSVTDPELAIDEDLNTKALLSVPLSLLIPAWAKQTVYFTSPSNIGDAITITLSVPPALLGVSLLSGLEVTPFLGGVAGAKLSLNSFLTLDLLGLFNSGDRTTVSLLPTGKFDRVEVKLSGGALGVDVSLNLHEVQRTPAKPTVPHVFPAVEEVCFGSRAALSATPTSPKSILRWYDQVNGGNVLYTGGNFSTPVINSTETTFYYVAAAWDTSCSAESERVKIGVNTLPKPGIPQIEVQ